jgi:molecular chaperone GrpE
MRDQRTYDELTTAQEELAEMEGRWRRAAADLANYRKRAERSLDQQRQQEREAVLRHWLPVVDNLERALMYRDSAACEHLWNGLEAVYRQAVDILGQYGVSRMQTLGTPFDPIRHDAISLAPGTPEGVILDEISPGYHLGEETLRPAQVIVAKGDGTEEGHDGF